MTDRQRLIYDLSLHCATLQVQRDCQNSDYLPGVLLDAFNSAILAYSAMSDNAIDAALEELKKV